MIFLDANVIYEAMRLAIKSGDRDRYVTQLYQVNHLLYTAMLQKSLKDGTYKPELGNKFVLKERGKTRFVTNNSMADKVVNHIICDEILTPTLQRFLIHDNGASQKGKGVSFHRERFEKHLRDYFRQHGTNEGFILLGDFSGYYANIRHDKCGQVLAQFFRRSDINRDDLVMAWNIAMMNLGVDESLLTGKKFLNKGVDIGNQTSQNIGLIFPFRLDNYAKIVAGIKGYGRYTDYFYAIAETRERLKDLLEGLKVIAKDFGIIVNSPPTKVGCF